MINIWVLQNLFRRYVHTAFLSVNEMLNTWLLLKLAALTTVFHRIYHPNNKTLLLAVCSSRVRARIGAFKPTEK